MGSTSGASLKSSDLAVDILSENYDLSEFDCEDPDYNDLYVFRWNVILRT